MKDLSSDQEILTLLNEYRELITRTNERKSKSNGMYYRWANPVLTHEHVPVHWRYDLDRDTNPFLMERLGINAVFNAGAIELDGKICLAGRVEGWDRKSFFAIAESDNGVDNFKFRPYPVILPELDEPDTNVYDMRLVKHEDGWIYGIFCTERKDPAAPAGDKSSAIAQCGIVRTRDLDIWERLPDLKTPSPQQRNCVLHPEFVDGKYAFYTRPQDDFISAGSGGGIGWGLCEDINNPVIPEEKVIEDRRYHTISELKNGLGPAPLKTAEGWLHLAHGVRNTAAGLRYVLYMFMTDLQEPEKVIYRPGGYFMAPEGGERVGDVSNVLFSNGWVARKNGDLFIYYGSSDTRMHVATTTIEKIVDYVKNTPADSLRSAASVQQRVTLVDHNMELLKNSGML